MTSRTTQSRPAAGASTHAGTIPTVEPATQAFLDALASQGGPPLYERSFSDARGVLRSVQAGDVATLEADVEDRTVPGGPGGTVSIRIVRPKGSTKTLPAVMYFHGGGWILGDKDTHDRLVRDLANATEAAYVFVNYTPSPEAHYPVPVEEAYAATRWVAENGATINVDPTRLAVAGDSVGGNMVAAVTLLAKERGGPRLRFQVMFYPVTDADFGTATYQQFAEGPWLTREAMRWFWDAYLPDAAARRQPTASPLRATVDQLHGLPPALLMTDEHDVLRDEGEAYAHKLAQAGVPVTAARYLGTIHDFALLNPITNTPAPRAAIRQASDALRRALA